MTFNIINLFLVVRKLKIIKIIILFLLINNIKNYYKYYNYLIVKKKLSVINKIYYNYAFYNIKIQ